MNYSRLRNFFLPIAGTVTLQEKLTAGITAFVGMVVITVVSMLTTDIEGLIIMSASMGSAAILLFAVPHSPMSQPWPMIGGHLVSAFSGVISFQLLSNPALAAGLAVALAIVAMFFLRCLNPPSGAVALGAVLGGPEIHELGYWYVLFPAGFNVLVILFVALIINNCIPGRRYPLMPEEKLDEQQVSSRTPSGFLGKDILKDEDLESALDDMDSYLDADREELKKLFSRALLHASKRKLGRVVCEDIMCRSVFTLDKSMSLQEAWWLSNLIHHRYIPVLDQNKIVCGLISTNELMRHSSNDVVSDKSEVIKQKHASQTLLSSLMTDTYQTAQDKDHIVDLVPLFNEQNVHLILVLGNEQRLLGVISRSDLMRALLPVRI